MSLWWVFESTYLADIFHDSESVVVINVNLPHGQFGIKIALHFFTCISARAEKYVI